MQCSADGHEEQKLKACKIETALPIKRKKTNHRSNFEKLACLGTGRLFSFLYFSYFFSTSKASVLCPRNVLETVTTTRKHRAVNATLDGESEVSRESVAKASIASLTRPVYTVSAELMV